MRCLLSAMMTPTRPNRTPPTRPPIMVTAGTNITSNMIKLPAPDWLDQVKVRRRATTSAANPPKQRPQLDDRLIMSIAHRRQRVSEVTAAFVNEPAEAQLWRAARSP